MNNLNTVHFFYKNISIIITMEIKIYYQIIVILLKVIMKINIFFSCNFFYCVGGFLFRKLFELKKVI